VTRSGARPGDVLALAGRLGLAAAGLAALSSGVEAPGEVLDGHRVPSPPYAAGPAASEAGATAMIDVSDGLLADLGHIARASGVAIDVRSAGLPRSPALLQFAEAMRQDPLHWLLTGGEDHALVATFPPGVSLPDTWTPIGSVRDGTVVTVDGLPHDGPPGWDHFTGRE
jgi:thiamine-monophosphate kinase